MLSISLMSYPWSLRKHVIACFSTLLFLFWTAGLSAQTVTITSLPEYGVDGFVEGNVTGINPATHHIATYIQIEGVGWWTKPTTANPTVPINPNGTFSVDVVTGGIDDRFTIVKVDVLPINVAPVIANPSAHVPVNPDSVAMAVVHRYGRTLNFAGYTWAVKEAPVPVGPGSNYFSDLTSDVSINGKGLKLSVNEHNGHWWATEVFLTQSLGYGTYTLKTKSRVDLLDENITFGGFTWDPFGDEDGAPGADYRELDFEDSRWGNANDPDNSQFVVQPYNVNGNLERFALPDLSQDAVVTRFFRWTPGRLEFVLLHGDYTAENYPPGSVIHQWVYETDSNQNHFVPTPGRETFRLNLWINTSNQPANGQPVNVLITDFTFTPEEEPCPVTAAARAVKQQFQRGKNVLKKKWDQEFSWRDFSSGELLRVVRHFRDTTLARSVDGRRIIDLYYAHGPEVSRILLTDPQLARDTIRTLVELQPVLRSSSGTVRIEAAQFADGLALLNRFEQLASPNLRAALRDARLLLNDHCIQQDGIVQIDFPRSQQGPEIAAGPHPPKHRLRTWFFSACMGLFGVIWIGRRLHNAA